MFARISFIALMCVVLIPVCSLGKTWIVDVNGGGDCLTITEGIASATTNDTVKIWPGEYYGAITVSKPIVIMGSGFENTLISSTADTTIDMSAGKLMWVAVTSTKGAGISLKGGTVTDCVIRGCGGDGIAIPTGSNATLRNCVMCDNGKNGVVRVGGNNTADVFNCISWHNTSYGYNGGWDGYLTVTYSCGSTNGTRGNSGNIGNVDPKFVDDCIDVHIPDSSPCWNTGNPGILDPDGSRSDMGYFGGPDCPIYPVVTSITLTPIDGGCVRVQAKARANY